MRWYQHKIKENYQSSPVSLLEGGHAFDDVTSVSRRALEQTWKWLLSDLERVGLTSVTRIGTTGKKDPMGDIDIAANYEGDITKLIADLKGVFGNQSIKKIGGSVVSISYPLKNHEGDETGDRAQVDVMVGDTGYLAWSRYGPSPERGHKEYSSVKGLIRNILIGAIMRHLTGMLLTSQQGELDRVRYVIDYDKGLYKTTQTRRNSLTGQPTKNWKTVDKEFVSDDPDQIVSFMFGQGLKAKDVLRFEDMVRELKLSPKLRDSADDILDDFVKNLETNDRHVLGDDPDAVIRSVKNIISRT